MVYTLFFSEEGTGSREGQSVRILKMAIMDSSLVNPRDVYSCPVAGVLAIVGPPVIPRPVERKAFQESSAGGSLAAPPCLSPRNAASWQESCCAGLPPCVLTRGLLTSVLPTLPVGLVLRACCTWSRAGISEAAGWQALCSSVPPFSVAPHQASPE